MSLALLNFVWSGVFIGESFIRFWYTIPTTIIIGMVVIKLMTFHLWGKSLLIPTVGNLVSGVIGAIVIECANILIDFLFSSDFFPTMFITRTLTLAGSFGLEYLTVRQISKGKSWASMWMILSGNILSHCFIAISLLVEYWVK